MVELNRIYNEDCLTGLKRIPDNYVDCCITSPPYYGLRNYGVEGQIGLEKTPDDYVGKLVDVFREVRRVLKPEGTLWLNLGDGYENKNLIGIPFMVAFALRADGWWLRQDIIWHKQNPMPEPVKDRCVKSHEYIFLMSKSERYYFDYKAIQEPATTIDDLQKRVDNGKEIWKNNLAQTTYSVSGVGRDRREFYSKSESGEYMRNRRDVWSVNTKPDTFAHFAVFPEDLIKPCVLAGCPHSGVVLDPFMGSGTTARVATMLNRNFIGFELNPEYVRICERKTKVTPDLFY